MTKDIDERFRLHRDWFETVYKEGEPLVVTNEDFRNYDFAGKTLEETYLLDSLFDGKNMRELSFYRGRLCYSSCKNTVVSECNFRRTDLEQVDFSGSVIEKVRFSQSDCTKTIFFGAALTECDFKDARLVMTDFTNANLCDMDITGAIFDRTILSGATIKRITGIRRAVFGSIIIGTVKRPVLLEDEDARDWVTLHNGR